MAKKAYFVGGGLASLAGAVYLIRDCGMAGEDIQIFESMHILGGSNDGIGTPEGGFVCRGGRMLNEETYENFWDLLRSIPSLENPQQTVTDDIFEFDHANPTNNKARLVDKDLNVLDVTTMGFSMKHRLRMLKLLLTKEEKLDNLKISDWFDDGFFKTNFWYMWQTTFAFQAWSSLFEFRRYMNRMILEFSRINTLEGVTRTKYNQYDSVILPIVKFLSDKGVAMPTKSTVTDIDFKDGSQITATAIHLESAIGTQTIKLNEGDICIVTNGCMTDNASLGGLTVPAKFIVDNPPSAVLWRNIAKKKPNLGNPESFFGNAQETNWESLTITTSSDRLIKLIGQQIGHLPGQGLTTFKDSNWLMSFVIAKQPHFPTQKANQSILWVYALYSDKPGDYIKKPMRDCTGSEIISEFLHHLGLLDQEEEIMADVVNAVPCMMPYIITQFQPRAMTDRPQVVPAGSTNFAMISQFVEIADDMVFTEEYSVRAARTAVYKLMNIDKKICPVTAYNKQPKVLWNAFKTSFR